jgi:chloramphenicol O-acetyltransferase
MPFTENNFLISKLNPYKRQHTLNVYKAGFAKKKIQIYFSLHIEPCYESQKKNVDMSRKLFFSS